MSWLDISRNPIFQAVSAALILWVCKAIFEKLKPWVLKCQKSVEYKITSIKVLGFPGLEPGCRDHCILIKNTMGRDLENFHVELLFKNVGSVSLRPLIGILKEENGTSKEIDTYFDGPDDSGTLDDSRYLAGAKRLSDIPVFKHNGIIKYTCATRPSPKTEDVLPNIEVSCFHKWQEKKGKKLRMRRIE